MSRQEGSSPDELIESLVRRVTELETLFTHLEHRLQQLDHVVIDQQKTIVTVKGRIDALLDHFESQRNQATAERNLEDEKPPHY